MVKLSVDQALARAKSHIKKGEPAEARRLYNTVLEAFPKNNRAQQGLAALNKMQPLPSQPGPPQEEINQLITLYNQNQLTAAVRLATPLTEQYPEAFILWNILGAANKGLGKTLEAAQAFKRVIALNPNYADGFNNLGTVLKDQGKLQDAVEAFKKAISLKPDNADAYYNLGNTLKSQGKLNDAIKAYIKELAISPYHAETYNNMGITFKQQGKLEDAIEMYGKALSLRPDYYEFYNNMANALQDKGELEEAIEVYKKAISLKPDNAEVFNNIGTSLKELLKLDEAIEAFKKAIALEPDYAEAHYNMGSAMHDQGNLNGAIFLYKKAISLKPDYTDCKYNMGNALRSQGKFDEAVDAFKQAIVLKPDYTEAYNNLGVIFENQGKLKEAEDFYNKALELEPLKTQSFINLNYLKIQLCEYNFLKIFTNKFKENTFNHQLLSSPQICVSEAISNFIQGKLNVTITNLDRYETSIQTKAFEALTLKDEKFCNAYFGFLSVLTKNKTAISDTGLPKIYHVGESHCLSYAHSKIFIAGTVRTITPKITFGAKAYHFANKAENKFKSIIKFNLDKLPKGSTIFISIGEIDCRPDEGILKASDGNRQNFQKIISKTVEGFIDWFLNQNLQKRHTYYFFNVPAPVYNQKNTQKVNNQVAEVVSLFNASLLKKTLNSNTNMIDVYHQTMDETRFSNELYHCDQNHLDSRMLPHIQNQLTN